MNRRPMNRIRIATAFLASTLLLVIALATTSVGATTITGTGANVTWVSGAIGSSSGSGSFACGVTATMTSATGNYNSGVAYPVDWSTSAATASAFSGGVTPASAIAILAQSSGNVASFAFGAEIVDPVVMVSFIDPGAAMDFGPNPITVLSYNSSAAASPTVVGNKISLDGPDVDTVNDGWAVKVTGNFGPTSGPLPFTLFSTAGETFAVSVASPTVCPPPPPGRPGRPLVTPTTEGLTVSIVPPTTGGSPESFVATAQPGGATCSVTGEAGSCTIDRLAPGQPYTVTVVATNASGDSPPSEPSEPVIPTSTAPEPSALPATGANLAIIAFGALLLLAVGGLGAATASHSRRRLY